MTFIELTVPVIVEGYTVLEFDCGAEIDVTYRGHRAQTYGDPSQCSPAEAPEWEVTDYLIKSGPRDWEWCRMPKALIPFVDEYLDEPTGRDWFCRRVIEEISETKT